MEKSNTFSRSSNQLPEPTGLRLQKDLEFITQSLEFEKRESTYLDEQIKLLQYEILTIPKPQKSSFNYLQSQISVNEKKLELEISILNKSKHKNTQLRAQINEYRLDKCAHKQSQNTISEHLEKTFCAAENQNSEIEKIVVKGEENQEKIVRMRAKSLNQRSTYEERFSGLISVLHNTGIGEKIRYEEKQYASQSIDVISVLKNLAKSSQKQTVDKKKEFDSYLRNLNVIRNAFSSIREVSGISVIEDIVTSCVKSQEQSKIVLFYLNSLEAESDLLKEKLLNDNRKIEELKLKKEKNEKSLNERKSANEKKMKKIQKKLMKKNTLIKEIHQKCVLAWKKLKLFYNFLEKLNFKPVSSQQINLETLEQLNSENCTILLGTIEEFSRFLLMVHELQSSNSLRIHKPHLKSPSDSDKSLIKDILEEKDLYTDPVLEEIRTPISPQALKTSALSIFSKRKSVLTPLSKTKSTTPDHPQTRTPTYKFPKDQL